jgi:uncharacterized protein (DUF1501 family)
MSSCTGPNGPDTRPTSRRAFLRNAGGGLGLPALAFMLAEDGLLRSASAATADTLDPLAPRKPHHAPKAKSVVFLFMSGGPSHLETFDPKPDLQRLHGQPLPASFGPVKTRRGVDRNKLLATKRTFARHGKSGIEVSDLFPHVAGCIDDVCVLRGCYGDSVTHPESVYLMNTGFIRMGRPSLGSWATYGLGTENRSMPGFVVLPDPAGWVKGGAPAWGNGFLPGAYHGTVFRGGPSPVLNLNSPPGVSAAGQRRLLDLVNDFNREHLRGRQEDPALSARIAAYELAFRMQSEAADVVDVSKESPAVRALYGLDDRECAEFGLRCLLARRMVERGVRFIQLYCGDTNGWDGHSDIEGNHGRLARQSDLPVAGLLRDLKSRGLLESTLVVWGGEFGRTPMSESTNGRDHNPHGFSMWMAGGGIRGGQAIGATDAIGLRAIAGDHEKIHVHDLHATILHLLGLDHERLTFRHNGRDERLTDVDGVVIEKALA